MLSRNSLYPSGLPSLTVRSFGVSEPGPDLDALYTAAAAAGSAALAERAKDVGQAPPGPLDDETAAAVVRAVRRTFALQRGKKPTVLSLLAGREVKYDEPDELS